METKAQEDENGDESETGGSRMTAISPTNDDELARWRKKYIRRREHFWNYIRFGNRMPASLGPPSNYWRWNNSTKKRERNVVSDGVIGIDLVWRRMISRSVYVDGTEEEQITIGLCDKRQTANGLCPIAEEGEQSPDIPSSDIPSSEPFPPNIESALVPTVIDIHGPSDSMARDDSEDEGIAPSVSTQRNESDLTIAINPTQGIIDTTLLRLTLKKRTSFDDKERSNYFRLFG